MIKKLLTTGITLFCLLGVVTATNPYYMLTKSTQTYTELTSPVPISGSTLWDFSTSGSTTPFQLNTNNLFTNIWLFGDGSDTYMKVYGGEITFTNGGSNQIYYMHAFTMIPGGGLKAKGATLSPISYQVVGTTPNAIVKVQWKNAGTVNNSSDVVNLQLWMYEFDKGIEFHYGPSTVANASTTQLVLGLGHTYVPNSNLIEDDLVINGPSNPVLSNTGQTFTGIPSNGTVYKFSKNTIGINEVRNTLTGVHLFPNPSEGKFSLEIEKQNESFFNGEIIVSSILGNVVYQSKLEDKNSADIDLSECSKGVYFITVKDEEKINIQKIVVN